MKRKMHGIERNLTPENIEATITEYNELLQGIPLEIKSENILLFLKDLKRGKLDKGPYPGISIFEAANRIMTDLTILYGVRALLRGAIPEFNFNAYEVEYGNENKNDHDIMAENSYSQLKGEAFNVAKSFFYSKKYTALNKLNRSSKKMPENYCSLMKMLYQKNIRQSN